MKPMDASKFGNRDIRSIMRIYPLLAKSALILGVLLIGLTQAFAQGAKVIVTHSYLGPVIDFGEVQAANCGGPSYIEANFLAQIQTGPIGMMVYGNTAIPISKEMTTVKGGPVFSVQQNLSYLFLNKKYNMTAVFEPIQPGTYEAKFRLKLHNFFDAQKLLYQWISDDELDEEFNKTLADREADLEEGESLSSEERTAALKETIDNLIKTYFSGPVPTGYSEKLAYLTLKGTAKCPPVITQTGGELVFSSDANSLTGKTLTSPLAAGDINNDGAMDVAVFDGATSTVNILIGDSVGSLQTSQQLVGTTMTQSVSLEDVNGDRNADLVIHERDSSGGLAFLGNGDGSFSNEPSALVQQGQLQATGDLNGDQISDRVVLNELPNHVTIYLGDGNGNYLLGQHLVTGFNPNGVIITDINNDGIADLLVSNEGDVSVFEGNGDGTFQSERFYIFPGTDGLNISID